MVLIMKLRQEPKYCTALTTSWDRLENQKGMKCFQLIYRRLKHNARAMKLCAVVQIMWNMAVFKLGY